MVKIKWIGFMAGLLLAVAGAVHAQHDHGAQGGETHEMSAMATQDVLVDGVVVGFAVMENAEHLKMLREMKMKENIEPGTTHNIMVTLKDQKTLKPIPNAAVTMRVVDPSGKDRIQKLNYDASMNSYDNYFNMPEQGRYQILIIARYDDQKKTAGIYYDVPQ